VTDSNSFSCRFSGCRPEGLALETPDADFLSSKRIRAVFTKSEMQRILNKIKKTVIQNVEDEIDGAWVSYQQLPDEERESRIYCLTEALGIYRRVLRDKRVKRRIELMLSKLAALETNLRDLCSGPPEEMLDDDDYYGKTPISSPEGRETEANDMRSIFSDVDE
jgi:hypothetical protein